MGIRSIAAAVAAVCLATPAQGQQETRRIPCTDRGTAQALLEKNHGELPVAIGIEVSGRIFELYHAPSGTFSVLITDQRSRSCLIFQGTGMDVMPAQPPGDES